MIDFNVGKERLNKYLGSEKKTTIQYKNELYMIKFPDPIRSKYIALSYMNNQYSEHIGCRIFEACGFDAQKTELGYYTDKMGKKKVVVACKDFTQDGGTLYEFSKLCNSIVEVDEKLGMSIESIALVINQSDLIKNKEEILDGFWDVFVIDTLIGNPDRHIDNWGILDKDGEIKLAPIYDCGSSLGALLDDDRMKEMLSDPVAFKNQEFNTTSCYMFGGAKIFYHMIYINPPDKLMEAVKRTVPKIDMDRIYSIVDSTERFPAIRKEYLKKALDLRYTEILIPAYERTRR